MSEKVISLHFIYSKWKSNFIAFYLYTESEKVISLHFIYIQRVREKVISLNFIYNE